MPSSVTVIVGTRKGCFVLESDGDRRDWEVRGPFCDGWPVYHAVHDPAYGRALRGRRERVARRRRLAQRRPRRDVDALERGPRPTRPDAEALQGLRPDRRPRARSSRAPRRPACSRARDGGETWSLLSDPRRPARPRRLERPGQAAAGPPRPARDPPASGRAGALLGRDPGLRHLRDDRRRRLVDAAQPRAPRRLAARGSRGRLLRPQARHVARRHRPASTSRTTSACTAATTAASRGRRSPRGSRPSSASPQPPIRTTGTAST